VQSLPLSFFRLQPVTSTVATTTRSRARLIRPR
jgi:hypothetical protein